MPELLRPARKYSVGITIVLIMTSMMGHIGGMSGTGGRALMDSLFAIVGKRTNTGTIQLGILCPCKVVYLLLLCPHLKASERSACNPKS